MKREAGNFQVTRDCCRTGFCGKCHDAGVVPSPLRKRTRVIQADNCSEAYAKYIAKGWPDYRPKVEPMTALTVTDVEKELARLQGAGWDREHFTQALKKELDA